MLVHGVISITHHNILIKHKKITSSHPEEPQGIQSPNIAKVRVDGSNPFARSSFSNNYS